MKTVAPPHDICSRVLSSICMCAAKEHAEAQWLGGRGEREASPAIQVLVCSPSRHNVSVSLCMRSRHQQWGYTWQW